jgi:hypothetical protein
METAIRDTPSFTAISAIVTRRCFTPQDWHAGLFRQAILAELTFEFFFGFVRQQPAHSQHNAAVEKRRVSSFPCLEQASPAALVCRKSYITTQNHASIPLPAAKLLFTLFVYWHNGDVGNKSRDAIKIGVAFGEDAHRRQFVFVQPVSQAIQPPAKEDDIGGGKGQ